LRESFDLVVIGAGPGGMAAAATAAESGMSVCLIDDNFQPGGQIWRSGVGKADRYGAASEWQRRIENGRVSVWTGWRAVGVSSPEGLPYSLLRVERDGESRDVGYFSLILATGARELFLPFPGWTLPGVYGAGGLQAFVKSGLDITGKRVVVAGTGPLLLAVAAAMRRAGARVLVVVEQAPMSRLMGFSLSLLGSHPGKLMEGVGYGWKTLGVPYRTGSWITRAVGTDTLRSVTVTDGVRSSEVEVDMLAIGYHLVPNTELAQLLGCKLQEGFVAVDARQETSVKRVFCVGEATGIGGVDKAQIEGRIAALAACGKREEVGLLMAQRDRQLRFALRLAEAFALREELRDLAEEDTIVCRCEDVAHGRLASCRSWREAKLHTRCGMGPCQGRVCSAAAGFLYGWEMPQPRPPLFPVSLATLVDREADAVPAEVLRD